MQPNYAGIKEASDHLIAVQSACKTRGGTPHGLTCQLPPPPTPKPSAAPVQAMVQYNGSHEDWMAAAGIAPSDYFYVDYIVFHESGWRVTAQAPNGPYGLCQSWPGNKMATAGPDWQTNPVTQLRWCSMHAAQYGNWYGSYIFWLAHRAW